MCVWQETRVRPFTMPIWQLCASALDAMPLRREETVATLLRYTPTDPVLCRAPREEPLAQVQEEELAPVLEWLKERLGGHTPQTSDSIFCCQQSEELMQALRGALEQKDNWQLAALLALAQAGKSTLLALAACKYQSSGLHLPRALQLFRLEEEFLIAQWGRVEGGHDIDEALLASRASAALLLLKLLRKP